MIFPPVAGWGGLWWIMLWSPLAFWLRLPSPSKSAAPCFSGGSRHCHLLTRLHIWNLQTEWLVSFVTPQVCDSQRVSQCFHDPAAPLRSSSSAQTLQGRKRWPQCEKGHHGRCVTRPDEQGEGRGRSRGGWMSWGEIVRVEGKIISDSNSWMNGKIQQLGDERWRHTGVYRTLKTPHTTGLWLVYCCTVTDTLYKWLSDSARMVFISV